VCCVVWKKRGLEKNVGKRDGKELTREESRCKDGLTVETTAWETES
jgi:hypothetical protein